MHPILFVWLVADGWCWFVLREKYCWLVADKPNEQGDSSSFYTLFISFASCLCCYFSRTIYCD
jgi:hypothetical protein